MPGRNGKEIDGPEAGGRRNGQDRRCDESGTRSVWKRALRFFFQKDSEIDVEDNSEIFEQSRGRVVETRKMLDQLYEELKEGQSK